MTLTLAWMTVGVCACLSGCGPEALVPAQLDEVCGEPAPFRILKLPPEEQPLASWGSVARIGERVFWVVGANEFEPSHHEHGYHRPRRTTVYATGPCGESPTVVAEDLHFVFEKPEVWPGQALACNDETGDIVVLDPYGAGEPQVVFADVTCTPVWTTHGVVATAPHDENTAALMLYPFADDPGQPAPDPVVLADPIRAESLRRGWWSSKDTFTVVDDEILALLPDKDLVRIDLPGGAASIALSDVTDFDISDSGRYILWQDSSTTNDDPEWPAGKVSLTDRETGVTTWIADTSMSWGGARVLHGADIDKPHLEVRLGKVYGDPKRIVLLPDLETHDVPRYRFVHGYVPQVGRWLVSVGSNPFDESYFLHELETGDEELLFGGTGSGIRIVDGGIEITQVSPWIDEILFDEGEVWFAPYDGRDPELVARRVSVHRYDLPDGRFLTALDIHGNWIGNLVLVDPRTLEESLVDTDVLAFSTGYNLDDRGPPYEDAIVYAVSDADRSGIWLTRIAPQVREGRSHVGPRPERSSWRVSVVDRATGFEATMFGPGDGGRLVPTGGFRPLVKD